MFYTVSFNFPVAMCNKFLTLFLEIAQTFFNLSCPYSVICLANFLILTRYSTVRYGTICRAVQERWKYETLSDFELIREGCWEWFQYLDAKIPDIEVWPRMIKLDPCDISVRVVPAGYLGTRAMPICHHKLTIRQTNGRPPPMAHPS